MVSLRSRKEGSCPSSDADSRRSISPLPADYDSNNSKSRRFGEGMLHPRILALRGLILIVAVGSLFLIHRFENYDTSRRNEASPEMSSYRKAGGGTASINRQALAMSPNYKPKVSLFQDSKKGKKRASQMEKRDKTGKVVYKPITSVRKEDLAGVVDAGTGPKVDTSTVTYEQAIQGREQLVDILYDAGVEDIDVESILNLPEWSSVTKLYGDGPVVLGLERCEEFRNNIPLDDASIGTAGLFNTGTNPFNMYLEQNCRMPHNTHDKHGGTRWQVPWGKHSLATRKWSNTAGRDAKVNKTNVLPVVLVRDPFSWMVSMCRHPYEARWPHADGQCPNLADDRGKMVPVRVRYKPPAHFDSLLHYWEAWYREYLEADYPRLMIRFEDLQFHAKELIDIVCQCAGAVARRPDKDFVYVTDSAKWGPAHKSSTNMITGMIKYGTDKDRFKGMTEADMKVAAQVLGDGELMSLFHYEMPPAMSAADMKVPAQDLGDGESMRLFHDEMPPATSAAEGFLGE